MNRKRRTEILLRGRKKIAKVLADSISSKYKVVVVQEAQNALIMVKFREKAHSNLFYLGEVLVTEAKVMIKNHLGTGILRGHDAELAYLLAVVDAAYNAELPETLAWEDLLSSEEMLIQQKQKSKQDLILKTKVNFETMNLDV
jgi:alpha-D-ribose 1-methylphosphonate 5-triphosphate synthase subunit PhnG